MSRGNAGYIRPGYDPLEVPNAPTVGAATAGDASVSVTFTAPGDVGGAPITSYGVRTVKTSDSTTISGTGASSPITVSGLTNGSAYTAAVWALNVYGPSPFSASTGSFTPAAPIGLFGGGITSGSDIDYLNLSTLGNSTSFGSLLSVGYAAGTAASSTRAVFGGDGNVIQYTTFASSGSFSDFGDLTVSHASYSAGMSSSTRGVFAGGQPSSLTNVIDYITIASTGNATDFGDASTVVGYAGGCSSTTRGVYGGGLRNSGFDYTNVIEYITIASTGNATDFGDLLFGQSWPTASCSTSTRGIFAGGFNNAGGSTSINVINYITIASTGNATDFGDLTATRSAMGCAASLTRGFFAGGTPNGAVALNIIEYITIASTGNATDYGDLTSVRTYLSGASNSHGGL